MSALTELQAELAATQARINRLLAFPEDTFFVGTIVQFSPIPPNAKWFILKTGEEQWKRLPGTETKELVEWALEAEDSNIGYFEAYSMVAALTPFFAYEP